MTQQPFVKTAIKADALGKALQTLLGKLGYGMGYGGAAVANAAGRGAKQVFKNRGTAKAMAQDVGEGLKSTAKSVAEHPIRRGVATPAALYYGGELASAPFAGDAVMQDKRENFWNSVAAGAGDQTASKAPRWLDWLLTPGRAYRAGGTTNASVPNKLHGDIDAKGAFTPKMTVPGKFTPGQGAENASQVGILKPGLSNYQKAQQALALRDERGREDLYRKMMQQDQPLQEQSRQSRKAFQEAFPNTKIPGVKPMSEPSFSELLGQGAAQAAAPSKPSPSLPSPSAPSPSATAAKRKPTADELDALTSSWQ